MSTAQNDLEVVAVESDEVEVAVGPRRIQGLVMRTAEVENEARAARVYAQAVKAKARLDLVSVETEDVDATMGPREQTALIFNAPRRAEPGARA